MKVKYYEPFGQLTDNQPRRRFTYLEPFDDHCFDWSLSGGFKAPIFEAGKIGTRKSFFHDFMDVSKNRGVKPPKSSIK